MQTQKNLKKTVLNCWKKSQIIGALYWSGMPVFLMDQQVTQSPGFAQVVFNAKWHIQNLISTITTFRFNFQIQIAMAKIKNQELKLKHKSTKISHWLTRAKLNYQKNNALLFS